MKRIITLLITIILVSATLVPACLAAEIIDSDKSQIDATDKNKGLFKVKYNAATDKKLKVKVEKAGAEAYSYDLNNKGNWESFPMQLGNGDYTVKVLENIDGNRYSVGQTAKITVKYTDNNAPFLNSIQNINFTKDSATVKKAAELMQGAPTDIKKVENVYKFIVDNITYDKDKAAKAQAGQLSGYVPAVDVILNSKKGICFDYSSLMAAMLRSQGIPAKMVFGYVAPNNVYHAWNEVYIKGEGWIKINGSIYFDGKNFVRMDSTFASSNKNGGLSKYLGDGSNYSNKYIY